MTDWQRLDAALREQGLEPDKTRPPRRIGGGDISAAWRLEAAAGPVFLKTGDRGAAAMFDAEADGLVELAAAEAVRVPRVLARGVAGRSSFLALEWLDLDRGAPVAAELGRGLAALHRVTAERFGWHRDNTIGLTPQVNTPTTDWVSFFREHRLGYQLDLAVRNGYGSRLAEKGAALAAGLAPLFDGYSPVPSLLHGDLWGGNWGAAGGVPVIFDPAVYYGDRETDLAMTRLFGGFPADFYTAYEAAWPLAPGNEQRCLLYQLYHVLNHLNLFGSGYLGRAETLLDRLLRLLR